MTEKHQGLEASTFFLNFYSNFFSYIPNKAVRFDCFKKKVGLLFGLNYAESLPGTPLYEYAREHGLIGKGIILNVWINSSLQ